MHIAGVLVKEAGPSLKKMLFLMISSISASHSHTASLHDGTWEPASVDDTVNPVPGQGFLEVSLSTRFPSQNHVHF